MNNPINVQDYLCNIKNLFAVLDVYAIKTDYKWEENYYEVKIWEEIFKIRVDKNGFEKFPGICQYVLEEALERKQERVNYPRKNVQLIKEILLLDYLHNDNFN